MISIGVDPGAHGAIGYVQNGRLLKVDDMPVDQVRVGRGVRNRVSPARLAHLLMWCAHDAHAFVEQVGSQPKEGVAGAFAFGRSCGAVEGVLAALGVPYTMVTSQTWKKGMQCRREKDASRQRACQLFPDMAGKFARKKDDGRAEAALIALYGDEQMVTRKHRRRAHAA